MTAQSGGKRGRGRPRVDAVNVGVRVPPDQLAPLDSYIAGLPEPRPGRPEAIRAILADWLAGRGYLAESTRAPVISQQPREDIEPTPAAEPVVSPVIEALSVPYVPTDAEIEARARAIVASRGASPDTLDDAGNPRWHRQREQARRDCLRGLMRG